jgi:cyclopropane fatty-acyl-phospholipid synthase-like methyltransferase
MIETDKIRDGYNTIAARYVDERSPENSVRFLEQFENRLDPGSLILDLGCGGGVPVDGYLVERDHKVIGLDISPAMLDLARRNVPRAEYKLRDMATLKRDEYTVDAVVSFFSIIHVDRRLHGDLVRIVRSFLPKGGLMLITMGNTDWEGEEEFLGVQMAWSHFGRSANRTLIEEAGFSILLEDTHPEGSPDDGDGHPIFLATAV